MSAVVWLQVDEHEYVRGDEIIRVRRHGTTVYVTAARTVDTQAGTCPKEHRLWELPSEQHAVVAVSTLLAVLSGETSSSVRAGVLLAGADGRVALVPFHDPHVGQ